MSSGIEFFVHGDAGRLVLLPEARAAQEAYAVAVDELTAAAVDRRRAPLRRRLRAGRRRGAGRRARALDSGCREAV